MRNSLNICDYYVTMWVIYYLQGTLYEEGSVISIGVLALLMLTSSYYFYIATNRFNKPVYFNGLNLMLLLITAYGIIRVIQGDVINLGGDRIIKSYTFLKDHLMSLLPIFAFYVFSKENKLTEKRLKVYTYVFFIISIIFFFRLRRDYRDNFGLDDFTNNSAYMFVQVLPLLVLSKMKRFTEYLLASLLMLFVLLAMKRGAILTGLVIVGIAFSRYFRKASSTTKISSLVILGVIFAASYYIIGELYLTNDYFRTRIEDTQSGSSSGRDTIYDDLFNHYLYGTSVFEFLFGTGPDSTLRFAGNYAHNDWLEIATTMGLVGLLAYVNYFVKFLKTVRSNYNDEVTKTALLMIFVFCILRTFFSMSINDMFVPTTCALGYSLAQIYVKKRRKQLV